MSESGKPIPLVPPFGKTDVEAMKDVLKLSPLPTKPPIPTANPWELGIAHNFLVQLSKTLQSTWSWEALESKISVKDNFLVKMRDGEDELTIHFFYRKSPRENAIPLLLLHGWPGELFNKSVSQQNYETPFMIRHVPRLPQSNRPPYKPSQHK